MYVRVVRGTKFGGGGKARAAVRNQRRDFLEKRFGFCSGQAAKQS